jgi:predicted metal-dependent HD superfamily phosphohydrolase
MLATLGARSSPYRQNVDMLRRWRAAIGRTGADVDAAGAELLARWSEPHRRYHTVDHLRAVLSLLDGTPAPVRLAAWFHDAVYDPRAAGAANEEASADLAAEVLTALGLPTGTVDEVCRLVRLTAGHAPDPGDEAGELLCDADLAVLAAPPEAYETYAAAVREEYAHVPDEAFRAGRAAVLAALLDQPVLFRHHPGWEAPARANLRRELATLNQASLNQAGLDQAGPA